MLADFVSGLQEIQKHFPTAMMGADHDMVYIYGVPGDEINENSFDKISTMILNERGWRWNAFLQSWSYLL